MTEGRVRCWQRRSPRHGQHGQAERFADRLRLLRYSTPDLVAKVSLVRLEKVPARTQDLDQLVKWQVRKTAPFKIEDAQITYAPAIEVPGVGFSAVNPTESEAVLLELRRNKAGESYPAPSSYFLEAFESRKFVGMDVTFFVA